MLGRMIVSIMSKRAAAELLNLWTAPKNVLMTETVMPRLPKELE